jgi:hypothetical protein
VRREQLPLIPAHRLRVYLRQRADLPGLHSPDGDQGAASGDLLSYLRAEPGLALVAYSSLLGGGYVPSGQVAYARPSATG